VPGQSYALELAQRLGLPEDLIQKASSYIGHEIRQTEKLLTELQEAKKEYENLQADQKLITQNMQRELDNLQKERAVFAAYANSVIGKYQDKLEKRLRHFHYQLSLKEAKIARSKSPKVEEKIRSGDYESKAQALHYSLKTSVEDLGKKLRAEAEPVVKQIQQQKSSTSSSTTTHPPSFWKVGMQVKCLQFIQAGRVVREANSKGIVECEFGALKVRVPSTELMTLQESALQKSKSLR